MDMLSRSAHSETSPDAVMADAMSGVLAEYTLAAKSEESAIKRAADGFLEGVTGVVKHPGDTALTVGTGLAAGAAIQFALNNAEKMGGMVGTLARAGRVAVIALPVLHTALKVRNADDSAHEFGKTAFEMGLFVAAAKLGTFADRIPGAGKVIGPRATSEVPENLKFQVFGNKVKFSGNDGPVQVRLANGNGFIAGYVEKGQANLIAMPRQVAGGTLEYGPKSTTLRNETGAYTRELNSRTVSTVDRGNTIHTADGKAFTVARPNGDLVKFEEGGRIVASQGTYESGTSWTFGADGSIHMASMPAGKYKFSINPEGEGMFTFTHGTSRGIRGIGGPRVRYAPLKRDELPFSITPGETNIQTPYGTYTPPDLTPVSSVLAKNLKTAAGLFESVMARPAGFWG